MLVCENVIAFCITSLLLINFSEVLDNVVTVLSRILLHARISGVYQTLHEAVW